MMKIFVDHFVVALFSYKNGAHSTTPEEPFAPNTIG
jgi:hypothetical protein